MDAIERLTALFEKFPGIGPRQAQRFVQYLLRNSPALRREIARAVQELGNTVRQCTECMRWHAGLKKICSLCSDTKRDAQYLAIVANDADLAALEKSGTYTGHYFVLGGTVSLASDSVNGLRIKQLLATVPARLQSGLQEIILAFPANPEGDATAVRLREEISQKIKTDERNPNLKITMLGRGLSTGSELEYADPETIKNAFEGRR